MNKTQRREMVIAKDNDIVRNTRYSLSLQQQKLLLFMISLIGPDDDINTEYTFKISEFAEVINLDYDTNNTFLKNSIKELRDSSAWVKIGKSEVLIAWLNTCKIENGVVKIKFHESVQPYLYELRQNYTSYKLNEVLTFKSKYSIRLYEILKSYAWGKDIENGVGKDIDFDIVELKRVLDASQYLYKNFKARILEPAVSEINAKSEEINITYAEIHEGRKVIKIIFTIRAARAKQRIEAREIKRQLLSK